MSKTEIILIQNGEVINADSPAITKQDVLIRGNTIEKMAPHIDKKAYPDAQVINAGGLWVMPGFIDMHVHLREPGQEYKEDIASGTLSALHGGYTSVCAMPNTSPVADDPSVIEYIRKKAEIANHCRVYPVAAITKGLKGEELSEMGLLLDAGAIAFSDDGKPVSDANRMRLAMQYATNFDALIMAHCEVLSLSDGVMREGYTSTMLGLAGVPGIAESAMVSRDILLAEAYGARLHICHVSTKESIELIRAAKARGVRVSCETAPHYFSATDEWVAQTDFDTNTKMKPPLAGKQDLEAVQAGLRDGTIDVIATDHAPHHIDEKNCEYNIAANGIVGLETAFSLAITNLVQPGVISPQQLVERMSATPAQILGVQGGMLQEGAVADITIADPAADIVYKAQDLHSKSKNSPFLERPYFGRIVHTIVDGVVKI